MISELIKEKERLIEFFNGYIVRIKLLRQNDKDDNSAIKELFDYMVALNDVEEEIYLKEIEPFLIKQKDLDSEVKRLNSLILLITKRKEEQDDLLKQAKEVTKKVLAKFVPIAYYEQLGDFKKQLDIIEEYIKNAKEINVLNTSISDDENTLLESIKVRERYEEDNKRYENELFNFFVSKYLTYNIDDSKYAEYQEKALEDKKYLELCEENMAFVVSYRSGYSKDEIAKYKEEYDQKIKIAKADYYNSGNIVFLIEIYSLLKEKRYDYESMMNKRKTIIGLMSSRNSLKKLCNIKTEDDFMLFSDLLMSQTRDIEDQIDNHNFILDLNKEIESKRARVLYIQDKSDNPKIMKIVEEYDEYVVTEPEIEDTVISIRHPEEIKTDSIDKTVEPQEEAYQPSRFDYRSYVNQPYETLQPRNNDISYEDNRIQENKINVQEEPKTDSHILTFFEPNVTAVNANFDNTREIISTTFPSYPDYEKEEYFNQFEQKREEIVPVKPLSTWDMLTNEIKNDKQEEISEQINTIDTNTEYNIERNVPGTPVIERVPNMPSNMESSMSNPFMSNDIFDNNN